MEQEQIIKEFAELVEKLVAEKTPHLTNKIDGLEWFKTWSQRPNHGLGYNKPIDVLITNPDAVRDVLNRITITPFYHPYN